MEYKSKISDRRKTKLILSLPCSIEENLTLSSNGEVL